MMALLMTLPTEMILSIADHLTAPDLTALATTNRRLNAIVMDRPELFRKTDPDLLQFGVFVAAFQGHFKIVKLLLDSGISPNFYYSGPVQPLDHNREFSPKLDLRRNRIHLNQILQQEITHDSIQEAWPFDLTTMNAAKCNAFIS
ncbi:hypothetical protein K449DRAFT_26939 [Hypoxylon sp. EC38]|nr:hypothetical protein K449DRAFT_26939 [Hypoxylon sp. EC38]